MAFDRPMGEAWPSGAHPAGQWNLVYPDRDMFKSGFGVKDCTSPPPAISSSPFLACRMNTVEPTNSASSAAKSPGRLPDQSPSAVEGASMSDRDVVLRRGRHIGWWVEGRSAGGRLFMKTWWPTEGLARAVARLVGARTEPGGGA